MQVEYFLDDLRPRAMWLGGNHYRVAKWIGTWAGAFWLVLAVFMLIARESLLGAIFPFVAASLFGAEFMFKFGPDGVGETDITRYNYIGAGNWNTRDLDCCISYPPDGLDATFPLAMLSGDDGRLNFKMVSGLKVSDTGFSGWFDVMPDVGLPAIPVDGG